MSLDDWIKWLDIHNYNSQVILNPEQSLQILKYLKELQEYKQKEKVAMQREIDMLNFEIDRM